MHLHPLLQSQLQSPSIIRPNTILSGACPICHQDVSNAHFPFLACNFNWQHFNIPFGPNQVFLRPIAINQFQVRLNYQTQTTSIGLYSFPIDAKRGLKANWHQQPLATLFKLLSWEQITTDGYIESLLMQ